MKNKLNNNLFLFMSIVPFLIGFSIIVYGAIPNLILPFYCYLLSFILLCYFFYSRILLKKISNLFFLNFKALNYYKVISIIGIILGIINLRKSLIDYSLSMYAFFMVIILLAIITLVKLNEKTGNIP